MDIESTQAIVIPAAETAFSWWLLLDPGIQFLAILAGFALIIVQLRRGHKNTLAAQAENQKNALKVEIHKEFLEPIKTASSKLAEAYVLPNLITAELRRALRWSKAREDPVLPSVTVDSLYDLHLAVLDADNRLIALLQNYEIIQPRMKIFRIAFSSARREILQRYWDYADLACRVLPEKSEDDKSRFITPTDNRINQLAELGNLYSKSVWTEMGYVQDLSTELQKALLGDLFQGSEEIEIRQPEDSKVKVIVLDDDEKYEELLQFFKEEAHFAKVDSP